MREKKRQANFEVLRMVAMWMVVTLHYLIKGKVSISMAVDQSGVNLFARLLQSACIVAVNVYVLISGYFLIEAEWKIKKLLHLLLQIWFYSLGTAVVCGIFGLGNVKEWNIYDWRTVIFPIQMEHYWFATAYVILYCLSPLLKEAVKALKEKQLRMIILLLLLFFSVGKSVIPILIPTDHYGYDFGWFLCLYLIAAYIRIYCIKWLDGRKKGFFTYFLFVLIIFAYSTVLGYLSNKGYPLSYAMDMTFSYNHLLVLVASLGLFYGFKNLNVKETSILHSACKLAPYSFGVYLLHENIAVRNVWQSWFGVERVQGSYGFFPHMIFTVAVVMVVGIMIDFIRESMFRMVSKVIDRN